MPNIVFWIDPNETVIDNENHAAFDVHGHVIGDEGSGSQTPFCAFGIGCSVPQDAVNAAILTAAIAAFETAEALVVGPLDRKTFFNGAVDL